MVGAEQNMFDPDQQLVAQHLPGLAEEEMAAPHWAQHGNFDLAAAARLQRQLLLARRSAEQIGFDTQGQRGRAEAELRHQDEMTAASRRSRIALVLFGHHLDEIDAPGLFAIEQPHALQQLRIHFGRLQLGSRQAPIAVTIDGCGQRRHRNRHDGKDRLIEQIQAALLGRHQMGLGGRAQQQAGQPTGEQTRQSGPFTQRWI